MATGSGVLFPLAIAAGVVLIYAGLCWRRPFRKCVVCDGKGKRMKVVCFWCRGMKVRLRIGRRIYNRFARLRAGDKLTASHRLGLKQ